MADGPASKSYFPNYKLESLDLRPRHNGNADVQNEIDELGTHLKVNSFFKQKEIHISCALNC